MAEHEMNECVHCDGVFPSDQMNGNSCQSCWNEFRDVDTEDVVTNPDPTVISNCVRSGESGYDRAAPFMTAHIQMNKGGE